MNSNRRYQGFRCILGGVFVSFLAFMLLTGCGVSQLRKAVISNDVGKTGELLKKGEKPEYEDLMVAVGHNNAPMVQLLLEKGADVNASNPNAGNSFPLVSAACLGHTDVVRTLLSFGAKVNCSNKNGVTPLMCASSKRHIDIARLLVEHGAEINAKDNGGCTPLVHAGYGGKVEIAQMLLARGAQANQACDNGTTALMNAVWASNASIELVQLLIDNGANVNSRHSNPGITVFSNTCQAGNADIAVFLYENGADPTIPNNYVETNGKAHHILADYFLSLDQHDKARESYKKAKVYYDRTIAILENDISMIKLKKFGETLLLAFAQAAHSYGSSYQASLQSRQFAEISAMKHAAQTHSGIQGYNAYMAKYNQSYVPTYITTNLAPLPTLPANASLDEKRAYMEEKISRFQGLSDLMGRVTECFDAGLASTDVHTCVSQATRARGHRGK